MAITSKEIITSIEKDYPQTDNSIVIKNCSDLDIEGHIRYAHHYLIGVTGRDPMAASIRHYEYAMESKLKEAYLGCKCLAWSFDDYELEAATTVLKELSEHFDANLDVDRMIRKLNIQKAKGEMYFIVVTIVFIPLISVEAD
jgi:hypothetical protein